MKSNFKKALKIFKYSAILFTAAYWIYILIDDYGLIKKNWTEHWAETIGIEVIYYLFYFWVFSLFYWLVATAIILLYNSFIGIRARTLR